MKFLIKFLIGIAVLILVIVVFACTMRTTNDVENGNMQNWLAAPTERRLTAVQILSASQDDNDLILACVDKIAALPDSGEMMVRDAVALCRTGLQLKENM